jgi:hypothetical protein
MTGLFGDLPSVLSKLTTILLNPTTNLTAAFLLYGIIALLLIVVLVVAIIALMGGPEDDAEDTEGIAEVDDEFERLEPGEVYEGRDIDERRDDRGLESSSRAGDGAADEAAAPAARGPKRPVPKMTPRGRLATTAIALIVVAAAWIGTGYTTSDAGVCNGCHREALQHAKAPAGTDPHAAVSCVACHESGGVFGRYVGGVPSRLMHFASQVRGAKTDEYGAVTGSACSACHASGLAGVATNKARGLKVSHKEPLSASATCLDCHAIKAGVVATYNAGMAPCLRCHDGKQASAKCPTCHDQNAATAARVRATSFASEQIPNITCGGCHDEKKQCDTCHGIRMPHSKEFMAYAHARAGAVDYWFNGGKMCSRCHTATRNPCTKCHASIVGRAHGTGPALALTHQKAHATGCDTCHSQWAFVQGRDFCKDLCHSPAAVASSPR